jgi:hypothetical protein
MCIDKVTLSCTSLTSNIICKHTDFICYDSVADPSFCLNSAPAGSCVDLVSKKTFCKELSLLNGPNCVDLIVNANYCREASNNGCYDVLISSSRCRDSSNYSCHDNI